MSISRRGFFRGVGGAGAAVAAAGIVGRVYAENLHLDHPVAGMPMWGRVEGLSENQATWRQVGLEYEEFPIFNDSSEVLIYPPVWVEGVYPAI